MMTVSFGFLLNSVLLGVGLAMDAFSVSLANGLNDPKMSKARMSVIAGVFAVFQAAMPMLGWICVHTIMQYFVMVEKAWQGGPPTTKVTSFFSNLAVSSIFCEDTVLMSSSITGIWELSLIVCAAYLFISTHTFILKPAASIPKSSPIAPEKRKGYLHTACPAYRAGKVQ